MPDTHGFGARQFVTPAAFAISLVSSAPLSKMSSSEAAPSVVERVQNFVSENKKAVLIGAAVAAVAIGGAAYYASSSGSTGDRASRKKDKKKSKSSKKRKGASDDGPLLEEVAPKAAEAAGEGASPRLSTAPQN